MKSIVVDGVTYVPESEARLACSRVVVVVDRGWIFAGDAVRENGVIHLSRAVWVFRWESIGFAGVIADPSRADIRPIANVEIPEGSEIFSIPVAADWGIK